MRIAFIALLLVCAACNAPLPSAPVSANATISPVTLAAPTPMPDDWATIAPGLQQRTVIPNASALAQMISLRIDPDLLTFRVHYAPGMARSLAQWQEALPDAQVIVNANFFTPEHTILGMLVSDGSVYGSSYRDRGGMFSLRGGVPRIQSLIREPYQGEALEQAVQAFPMLVLDGSSAYTNARDVRASRRTVIGMDRSGHVILMATPGIGLGLYDLSAWLPEAGLDLVSAFNLDGGGSTMMGILTTGYMLNSIDAVPAVLAAYYK